MPNLIMISGPIASGKSTICEQLLKQLKNYAFVNRAYLKDMLKPIGKTEAKEVANKATIFITRELMKLNKNILVQERNSQNLQYIVKKYGKKFDIYSFYLTCSLLKGIKRDSLRSKRSGDIKQITESYKTIKPQINDTIIDTEKNSVEGCVNTVLSRIQPTISK